MDLFAGKNILVTGGTGLIGRPLVKKLLARGAKVRVVSLDDSTDLPQEVEFLKKDLMIFSNCLEVCSGQDIVFQLAGIKGSPAMTRQRPASFFVPTLTFNTNMMEAARRSGVNRYLFTSTVGVYSPAEVFYEDDVWKTFPSPNDRFAGWAKRMGELQAEAYQIEYGWENVHIVRPANVYGEFDNFDPENAMVIPSLIRRVFSGENPLTVWGDGTPIRDFIHAEDVANGMIQVMESGESRPVNLGSGEGVSIKKIVEIILENFKEEIEVVWDTSKPKGDQKRLMDIARARSCGFSPQVSIEQGIKKTMDWFRSAHQQTHQRYNVFTDRTWVPDARL